MKIFYTDGSANPNPGPGGYAVISAEQDDRTKEITIYGPVALGCEKDSTNIRMEAQALIAAYKIAEANNTILTDSEFWCNVVKKWAPGWKANGWKKKTGPIKNLELVQELYDLYCQKPEVNLEWTRGHVGTEGNEAADVWANKARTGVTMQDAEKGKA
jgi:ribonuclease HI